MPLFQSALGKMQVMSKKGSAWQGKPIGTRQLVISEELTNTDDTKLVGGAPPGILAPSIWTSTKTADVIAGFEGDTQHRPGWSSRSTSTSSVPCDTTAVTDSSSCAVTPQGSDVRPKTAPEVLLLSKLVAEPKPAEVKFVQEPKLVAEPPVASGGSFQDNTAPPLGLWDGHSEKLQDLIRKQLELTLSNGQGASAIPQSGSAPTDVMRVEVCAENQSDSESVGEGGRLSSKDELPGPHVPEPQKENSAGSLGHPEACAGPCKYFWKRRGCKDGPECTRCHMCAWHCPKEDRQLKRKKRKQRAASKTASWSSAVEPAFGLDVQWHQT